MPATTREAWARLRVDGLKVPSDLRKAEGLFRKGGRRAGRKYRDGIKQSLKELKRAGGLLGAVGVTAGLAQGFQEARQFEDQLQRLTSQARLGADGLQLWKKRITEVSAASGIARGELAGALDEMVNLQGKDALNSDNLKTLSRAMLGTGTAGRDLAGVMFTLKSNMGILDDEQKRVLGGIDKIGTEASIPFSQLASSYTEVAAAAGKMGVKGPEGVFATVAAMQTMRKEITTPDEIKTSITSLVTELVKKRRQIAKKLGVKVTTGRGRNEKLRDLITIFNEIDEQRKKGKFGEAAFDDLFGKRAAKGANALFKNFDRFKELIKLGQEGFRGDFIETRAIERGASAAGRMDRAVNNLKQSFSKPFNTESINNLAKAIEGAAKGVNMVIRGYSELFSLFDEKSRNRRLIADTSNKGIANAIGQGATDLGLTGAAGLGPVGQVGGGLLRPKGEVSPFDRPHVRRARQELAASAARRNSFMNSTIREFEAAVFKGTQKALRGQTLKVRQEQPPPGEERRGR